MSALRPVALRVGPLSNGQPAIEFVFSDGGTATVDLSVADASKVADRLRECVDGRICQRPPSRRAIEIPVSPFPEESVSVSGGAIVPDLERDLRTQGPL